MSRKPKDSSPVKLRSDSNPYGAFINVALTGALGPLTWDTSVEGGSGIPAPAAGPPLHVSVTHSSTFQPLLSQPVACGADGTYAFSFTDKFRRDPTLDALHSLLDHPPVLGLHDTRTGALLASSPLDLTDFGLGHSSTTLHSLTLAANAHPVPLNAPAEPAPVVKAPPAAPTGGKKAHAGAAAHTPAPAPEPPATPLPPPRLAANPPLPPLTLYLTHRPLPPPDPPQEPASLTGGSSVSGSRPGTGVSGAKGPQPRSDAAPADADAASSGGAAAALGTPLALEEPFSYLPEGEVGRANVMTLRLGLTGPLPPGLGATSSTLPGRVSVLAALQLPSPGPTITLPGGVVVKDAAAGGAARLVWPGAVTTPVTTVDPATQTSSTAAADGSSSSETDEGTVYMVSTRRVLSGAAVAALLAALDGCVPAPDSCEVPAAPLGVELGRLVMEDRGQAETQGAYHAYHAWAPLPAVMGLLEGGQARVPPLPLGPPQYPPAAVTEPAEVPETANSGVAQQEHTRGQSAPAGDPLVVLEVPLQLWQGGDCRGPLLPPWTAPAGKNKPVEDIAGDTSAWAVAGTKLVLQLSFAAPLVPPWQGPPAPSVPLQELIPARDLHPPPPPPTPQQQVQQQWGQLVQQLAAEFAIYGQEQQQQQGWGAPQQGLGRVPPDIAYKPLVKTLNKSGKYLHWREALKQPLTEYVRGIMGKSGLMGPEEMNQAYHALHARMLGMAHAALNAAARGGQQRESDVSLEPAPDAAELVRLADLALVCELVGEGERAGVALEQCRMHSTNPLAHYHAGCLFSRQGQPGRPARALQEALEVAPTHMPTVAALAALHSNTALSTAAGPDTAAQGGSGGGGTVQMALAAGHRLLQLATEQQQQQGVHASAAGGAGQGTAACDAQGGLAWALLHAAYTAGGDAPAATACLQELQRRERAALTAAAADNRSTHAVHKPAEEQQTSNSSSELDPVAAVGVVALWRLAVRLGLRSLAGHAMALAKGPLSRACGGRAHAAELLLLSAEMHLLPLRPAGGAQIAASEQQQQHVQPQADAASVELASAFRAARAALKLLGSPSSNSPAGGKVQAPDLLMADGSAPPASEQAPQGGITQQQEHDWQEQQDNHQSSAAAAEDDTAAGATDLPAAAPLSLTQQQMQMLLLAVQPQLLLGDVAWERGQLLSEGAGRQGPAGEQWREARRAYQAVLVVLHEGGWVTALAAAGGLCTVLPPPALLGEGADIQWQLGRLLRGLWRLGCSYLSHVQQPQCAADTAAVLVALWPLAAPAWALAAAAAEGAGSGDTHSAAAAHAWQQANLCDVWDGRPWQALAVAAYSAGRLSEGDAALERALALHALAQQAAQHATAQPQSASAMDVLPPWAQARLAVPPGDVGALLLAAAQACHAVGLEAQAVRHLQRAVALGAAGCQVHLELAALLEQQGDVAGSLRAAEQGAQAAEATWQHGMTQPVMLGAGSCV